ncbi:MAG: hypothetical protein ACOC0D_05120 [Spirochaeta sp.]
MTELTRTVLEYQRGNRSLQDVFRLAAPLIYYYPQRSRRGNEDSCGEFLLYFYKRMIRLLHRYEYRPDHCFDAYLHTSMRFQYSTFLRRHVLATECRENHQLDYTLLNSGGSAVPSSLQPASRSHEDTITDETPEIGNPVLLIERLHILCGNTPRRITTLKKRIMILALINCRTMTPGEISACAAAADAPVDDLSRMIDTLRQSIHERSRRSQALQRRRNRAFVELFVMQQRLQRSIDPEEKQLMHRYCIRSHNKLKNARTQLQQVRNQPMHHEIAAMLGIPTGSVHSSIAYLKKVARSIEEKPQPVLEPPHLNMVCCSHEDIACNEQRSQGSGNTAN